MNDLIPNTQPESRADTLMAIDPGSGKVLRRLPGAFPAGAHGDTVATCKAQCPAVELSDLASGRHVSVRPPTGYRFLEDYEDAFSPDGSLLAVPLARSAANIFSPRLRLRVALVDVRTATVHVLPGSQLDRTWAAGARAFA